MLLLLENHAVYNHYLSIKINEIKYAVLFFKEVFIVNEERTSKSFSQVHLSLPKEGFSVSTLNLTPLPFLPMFSSLTKKNENT